MDSRLRPAAGPRRSPPSSSSAPPPGSARSSSTGTTCGGRRPGRRRAAGRVIVRRAGRRRRRRRPAGAVERPHPGARVRRRRVDGVRRHGVVHRVRRPAAVPARRPAATPGRRDAGAGGARRRPLRRPARRRPTALLRASGRPTPTARPAEVVNEIVRVGPRTAAPRCWSAAPTSCPTRGWRPDGATLSLAAVGPPGHAVGRRPARRPRRRRHRARASPAARASRSSSPRGATTASLWFFSDRTDFWSLYRWRPHGEPELVVDVGSDIAGPQWVFGQSRLRFPRRRPGRVRLRPGRRRPARRLEADGTVRELDVPYTSIRRAARRRATRWSASAGRPGGEPVVLRVDVDGGRAGGPPPGPRPRPRPRAGCPSRSRRPSRPGRRHGRRGARPGLPADQPGLRRPGRATGRRCWS